MVEEEGRVTAQERVGTLVLSVFFVVAGILWCFASASSASKLASSGADATFVPFWAGALLAFMGAALFLVYWREIPVPDAPGEPPLFEWVGQVRVTATFVVLLIYIVALERVHFAISTFVMLIFALLLSGEPPRVRLLLIAAALTAVLFAVFLWALRVPLPGGRFGLN